MMKNDQTMKDILNLIKPIIIDAGNFAKSNLHSKYKIVKKADDDIVTEIDLQVEDKIISFLQKEFPAFGIISEEAGMINKSPEYNWILDPIDGSKHYCRELPFYSISLALKHYDEYCLGIVYSPETNEMFYAIKNKGAFLNDRRIFCSNEIDLKKTFLCIEIPHSDSETSKIDFAFEKMKYLFNYFQRIRIIGIASLGLCYTANGAFGSYINFGSSSKEWDLAGGEIIVNEAGGQLLKIDNIIIAGPKQINDKVIQLLEK